MAKHTSNMTYIIIALLVVLVGAALFYYKSSLHADAGKGKAPACSGQQCGGGDKVAYGTF